MPRILAPAKSGVQIFKKASFGLSRSLISGKELRGNSSGTIDILLGSFFPSSAIEINVAAHS